MDSKDLQAISELLDKKLGIMQSDFNKKFQTLQSQLDEHTQILKALEEASKVHKAGMDNLTHQVAEVRGEITEVRKDLSRIEIATAENWTDIAKLKAVK